MPTVFAISDAPWEKVSVKSIVDPGCELTRWLRYGLMWTLKELPDHQCDVHEVVVAKHCCRARCERAQWRKLDLVTGMVISMPTHRMINAFRVRADTIEVL